jgi:uncharacterized protein (TIGR03067 family)
MSSELRILLPVASLLMMMSGQATLAGEEEAGAKKPELASNWKVESATLEGQAFPAEIISTMTLRMRGGRYEAHVGPQLDRGSYKVNNESTPMQMDITGIEGVNKGTTFLAIYDWQKDKLRICYGLEKGKRPTKFDASLPGQFLVVYKREKK